MTDYIAKIKQLEERYEELSIRLGAPDAYADPEQYVALLKEWNSIEPILLKYRTCLEIESKIDDNRRMMKECDERELVELLAEEIDELACSYQKEEAELIALLRPSDPRDEKDIIVEIRAGAGGEEAALFVADLFRMYCMYCDTRGYKLEVIFQNPTELGGYREIDFTVSGKGAFTRFKFESGVHRVQRVPKTESQGRIQTSTVTVAVLTEPDEVEVVINPQDIKIESCKSSGAGGQHINKTESAVRLTHIPTGIVVECQQERSQLRNKEMALKLLKAKLYHIQSVEQADKIASDRKKQVGTGERSEKIRTYNYPQSRLTDHRIGFTVYTLNKFLDGEMDALIEALVADEAKDE